jgi:hypothetical protein
MKSSCQLSVASYDETAFVRNSAFSAMLASLGIMLDMDAKKESATSEPLGRPPAGVDVDPHDGDVDITPLWHMLSMTPAERLDFHDAFRRSLLEMRRAGRKHYGITGYDEIDPQGNAE